MAEMDGGAEKPQIQQSFRDDPPSPYGKLYLVGTPIGNLEDMTFRAVQTLKEADWIAAEDTRQTRKLLSRFDIHGRLVSYHEHNKEKSGKTLLSRLLAGESVALVTDAGMPAISDPGADLAAEAAARGIDVVPVPGPNAALTALVASGLPADHFTFFGCLPREKKKAEELLKRWEPHPFTMLFYEAPHRIAATLKLMLDVWGDRRAVLARELTKRYEEFARGTLSSCLRHVTETGATGEYCLIVEGNRSAAAGDAGETGWWVSLTPEEHVAVYERKEGLSRMEAIKRAAGDRKMPKRELYRLIHTSKK